jgi:subtilisin family serine protease
MKKHLLYLPTLLMLAGVGTCFNVSAQVRVSPRDRSAVIQAKTDPASSKLKSKNPNAVIVKDNSVGVIITIDETTSIDDLEAQGLKISGRIGNHIYGLAPIDNIDSIAGTKGVKAFSLSHKKMLRNDKARTASNVNDVQTGSGLSQAYNGEGVIASLFDGGLDPAHITFKDSDGNTRVKTLRCYGDNSYADNDDNLSYTDYTSATIGNFTTDDDEETHGTHVLGTIAGSYSTTNKGNDYHGVAPKADIAITCGSFDDLSILDGIKYLSEYGKDAGKPIVINMSLGDNYGPHDGTDAFTSALNEIAKDTPIILASGNEREDGVSIVKTFTASSTTVKTVITDGYYASDYTGTSSNTQGFGFIDVWSADSTPFKVYLDIISSSSDNTPLYSLELTENEKYVGKGSAWRNYLTSQPTSGTTFDTYYSSGFMGGYAELDATNNRYHAYINVLLNPSTSKRGYVAIRVEGQAGQKVYIFADDLGVELTNKNLSGYTSGSGECSISNMACGKNTISVGAYTSRGSYSSSAGKICSFSSYGELHDGRALPDVIAPGSSIYSAYSSYVDDTTIDYSTVNGTKYAWGEMQGTSMAAPHVTGIVALMLQANPNLSVEDIRSILTSTATASTDTGSGAGKVNALAAVLKAEGLNGVSDIKANAGNIIIEPTNDNVWEIYAPNDNEVLVSVYSIAGTNVKQTRANGNYELNLDSLTPGIYLISVKGAKSSAHAKVVVK